MLKIKAMVVALGLLGGCMLVNAKATAADTEYGVFTIKNSTNDPINYQLKWGDKGEWKTYTVEPGTSRWHAMELDEFGTLPKPYVRFDYILNDGKTTWKTYSMEFYSAADTNADVGKPYTFRVNKSKTLLDLFAD